MFSASSPTADGLNGPFHDTFFDSHTMRSKQEMHSTDPNRMPVAFLPSVPNVAIFCCQTMALILMALVTHVTAFGRSAVSAYAFSTLAGRPAQGSADGNGAEAQFNVPTRVAVDSAGNVFVADTFNATIRRITPEGVVTTFAGRPGLEGSADGAGSSARFSKPNGLEVDSADNLYVADSWNNTIRKITPMGVVTTFAGIPGVAGKLDGDRTAAQFNNPQGLAIDSGCNLYVADTMNCSIRMITPTGDVTTVNGSYSFCAYTYGVTVDRAGNIYFVRATASTIRRIAPNGAVSEIDDSAHPLWGAGDVQVDGAGNLYVADTWSHTVRKFASDGTKAVFAGSIGGSGYVDGVGAAARFSYQGLSGLALDAAGNVYAADANNTAIRKITPSGKVTTLAGGPGGSGSTDGSGYSARFNTPSGAAIDGSGNVYIADTFNSTIRKIAPDGVVSTIAGIAGQSGSVDGQGATARFSHPSGVALDSGGTVFVADSNNHTIRRITTAGAVTTLAGSPGKYGSADGTGEDARFWSPSGIAVDQSGNLFVADTENSTIRKVTPEGVVSTWAGSTQQPGDADGTGATARFRYPRGLAVDTAGTVYVADVDNHTIRKITQDGSVTTLAGIAGQYGSSDGAGADARFNNPYGVALDNSGHILVADYGNGTVRQVTAGGVVTTIAGRVGQSGSADGVGSSATFCGLSGLAADGSGKLYVADSNNHAIRKGVLVTLTIVAPPTAQTAIAGNAVSFSIAVFASPPLSYHWQSSPDGGANWTDLTDAAPLLGSATNLLTISGATIGMSGQQFRCVVSNPAGSLTSDPATLSVQTALAAWRLTHFGTDAATGNAADLADPDSDGCSNLLEYAFGSDPTVRDASPGFTSGMVTDGAGRHLTLTFNRIADPALIYLVAGSNDLVAWTPLWTSSGAANLAGSVTVTDSGVATGTQPRRFIRLSVSSVPVVLALPEASGFDHVATDAAVTGDAAQIATGTTGKDRNVRNGGSGKTTEIASGNVGDD